MLASQGPKEIIEAQQSFWDLEDLSSESFTINYPDLALDWNFSFDDQSKIAQRPPRLYALSGPTG